MSHDEIELASVIADRAMSNSSLRKKLWLAVAKKVISQSTGIRAAIEFLKRCELLKIEDLIPFFPDFVVIDDFKDEICTALEDYSRNIDALKKEMDESSLTAANIKVDIAALDKRYAIVEASGEVLYLRLAIADKAVLRLSLPARLPLGLPGPQGARAGRCEISPADQGMPGSDQQGLQLVVPEERCDDRRTGLAGGFCMVSLASGLPIQRRSGPDLADTRTQTTQYTMQ